MMENILKKSGNDECGLEVEEDKNMSLVSLACGAKETIDLTEEDVLDMFSVQIKEVPDLKELT